MISYLVLVVGMGWGNHGHPVDTVKAHRDLKYYDAIN